MLNRIKKEGAKVLKSESLPNNEIKLDVSHNLIKSVTVSKKPENLDLTGDELSDNEKLQLIELLEKLNEQIGITEEQLQFADCFLLEIKSMLANHTLICKERQAQLIAGNLDNGLFAKDLSELKLLTDIYLKITNND